MMYRNVIICFFLVFAYGCSDSNNDDGFGLLPAVPEPTPIQPASAGQPGWLYVQTAATAQMTSDTVLEIPFTRDVFGFTDRPYREHAYFTAFEFASFWSEEEADSFSAEAPNAVLTWLVGEEQREAEVIINNATVYSDGVQESLVYEVTLETEQMPDAQMSYASLFVDSSAGWSKKTAFLQNPGASMGYDKVTMCKGPCPSGSGDSTCGACTGTATERNNLKTGLEKTCPITYAEISVGHAMYPGQLCGTCVLLKCVDGPDADSKCLNTTSFLHQRVDNPYGTSHEISVSSFCKRWGCGKPRSKTPSDNQSNAAAKNFYSYKKADCKTGKPI